MLLATQFLTNLQTFTQRWNILHTGWQCLSLTVSVCTVFFTRWEPYTHIRMMMHESLMQRYTWYNMLLFLVSKWLKHSSTFQILISFLSTTCTHSQAPCRQYRHWACCSSYCSSSLPVMWTTKLLSLINLTTLTNQATNLEQSNQCETHWPSPPCLQDALRTPLHGFTWSLVFKGPYKIWLQ